MTEIKGSPISDLKKGECGWFRIDALPEPTEIRVYVIVEYQGGYESDVIGLAYSLKKIRKLIADHLQTQPDWIKQNPPYIVRQYIIGELSSGLDLKPEEYLP